jgi:hypothetical protein
MSIPGWQGGPYQPAPPPKNNNTLRIVLIVVGAVAVLCCGGGIIGGVYLFHSYTTESGPARDAADQFVTDLQTGDAADAYGLLCDDTRGAMTPDRFAQGVAAQPKIAGHKSAGVKVSTGTDGTTAIVTMNLTMQNGFAEQHAIPMVKEDGAWKVCGSPY